MSRESAAVVYWDSSAILSTLFRDRHSEEALARALRPGVHLLSTLAWAEVHAVIARMGRERVLADALLSAARQLLDEGSWRRVNASPDWLLVRELATRRALRGSDLWHLAAAKTLQLELPELTLLSFDARLASAARETGLA